MKYIDTLDLTGKTVLLRLNLNVPIENGKIKDDFRIKAVLPTIEYCRDHARKTVILAHLGRPGGKRDKKYSLKPVADYLEDRFKEGSSFLNDCLGDDVKTAIDVMADGAVILLENLRFHKEEMANDETFGKALAALGDVYVNDAFGDSAKENASVVWPPLILPSGAGFRFKYELENLKRIKDNAERPLVVIIGGAKISEKMGAITNLGKHADKILLGGAIANTVLAAQGIDIKSSYYKKEELDLAKDLLKQFADKIVLPTDAVVSKVAGSDYVVKSLRVIGVDELEDKEAILDIGPESLEHFMDICKGAKTIFWAGPLGYIEASATAQSSIKLAQFLASLDNYAAIGGGETVEVLNMAEVADEMDFVSTGGGASLRYLSGESLPGLMAIK